jgi:ABC-2 type transport system permease protein
VNHSRERRPPGAGFSRDFRTVLWKEVRELAQLRRERGGPILSLVISLALLGIVLPWQIGLAWLDAPVGVFLWSWVSLFLAVGTIADAIAGERERHTLETLLSSRLSEGAILAGKTAATTLYGWVLSSFVQVLAWITINLGHRGDGLVTYSPLAVWGGLSLSLLSAAAASSAGVLISLRTSTVRQAQRQMNLVVLALVLTPAFLSRALPAPTLESALRRLKEIPPPLILLGLIGTLLLLVLVLLAVARARFRRARLLPD